MNIGILDDDETHNAMVAEILRAAGYRCEIYSQPQALINDLRRQTFDLLIVDWVMPQMTGLDVIRLAHEVLVTPPPILLLTNRSTENDVVEALNAGADDYVTKPCAAPVLLARTAALLRRAYPTAAPTTPVTYEGWCFDPKFETASRGDEIVALTAKEFSLALVLFQNTSRALSRSYLLERVWGLRPDLETRTLDSHVSKLRTKLSLRPANGFRLVTLYGFGYRLERSELST
jgi:DNA-binding response OmpR family regulator